MLNFYMKCNNYTQVTHASFPKLVMLLQGNKIVYFKDTKRGIVFITIDHNGLMDNLCVIFSFQLSHSIIQRRIRYRIFVEYFFWKEIRKNGHFVKYCEIFNWKISASAPYKHKTSGFIRLRIDIYYIVLYVNGQKYSQIKAFQMTSQKRSQIIAQIIEMIWNVTQFTYYEPCRERMCKQAGVI